jgi:hypothetical protein
MGALRLQQEMAMEKYEKLSILDKRRINMELDRIAKEKGFFNGNDMKEKKPHIWGQYCADTTTRLF